VDIIERRSEWLKRYDSWKSDHRISSADVDGHYPFVENKRAPFVPARSALPRPLTGGLFSVMTATPSRTLYGATSLIKGGISEGYPILTR